MYSDASFPSMFSLTQSLFIICCSHELRNSRRNIQLMMWDWNRVLNNSLWVLCGLFSHTVKPDRTAGLPCFSFIYRGLSVERYFLELPASPFQACKPLSACFSIWKYPTGVSSHRSGDNDMWMSDYHFSSVLETYPTDVAWVRLLPKRNIRRTWEITRWSSLGSYYHRKHLSHSWCTSTTMKLGLAENNRHSSDVFRFLDKKNNPRPFFVFA